MSCWLCKNLNDDADDDERERNETREKSVPHDFNFTHTHTLRDTREIIIWKTAEKKTKNVIE